MASAWVVTGSNGQLGRAFVRNLSGASDAEIIAAVDIEDVDIADEAALRSFFSGLPTCPGWGSETK